MSHCYKNLKDIGSIRKCLERKDLEELVHAVIASRLDYCNSLLMNVSQKNINKLQKLQNSAARLVLGKNRRFSGTSVLSELHLLNVNTRIMFDILLLVFKIVIGQNKCNFLKKI